MLPEVVDNENERLELVLGGFNAAGANPRNP
jgi:hypothetical protein